MPELGSRVRLETLLEKAFLILAEVRDLGSTSIGHKRPWREHSVCALGQGSLSF